MPPLKPVLTSTPPVAPLDSFTSSLATARNPSFLAPLSHVVDPAGPSGQVDGLASPVVPSTTATGPDLVVASAPSPQVVQRIRAPRMWLSAAEPIVAPAVQRVSAAADMPVVPDPAEQLNIPDQLRMLPTATPAYQYELTSAPDQGVHHSVPVLPPAPAPPSPDLTTAVAGHGAAPTVSRQIADPSDLPRVDHVEAANHPPEQHADALPVSDNGSKAIESATEASLIGSAGAGERTPGTESATVTFPVESAAPASPPPAALSPGLSVAPTVASTHATVQRYAGPTGPGRSPGLGAPLTAVPPTVWPAAVGPSLQRSATLPAVSSLSGLPAHPLQRTSNTPTARARSDAGN
ncbi:MAG: hypothetical protein ABWZ98_10745, partial [Nakamurella sp.]